MKRTSKHIKRLLIITLALLTITIAGTHHAHTHQVKKAQPIPVADGIKMQKGTMIVYKNGKASAMTSEIVLTDGSRVMMDGTVIRQSGTKLRLKEGDHIDMNGKITNPTPSKNP